MIDLKKLAAKMPSFMALATVPTLLFASQALASDSAGGWRDIYDVVMKWVNFGIFAFIVFMIIKKFKGPLWALFAGDKADLENRIDNLEKEKEDKIRSIDSARKELEGSEARLTELKEKMTRRGEREKEAMIEAARDQSRLMLESAQRKVAYRIEQAKANFRAELIDSAVNAAIKQLPSQVTDADNEKLLGLFLDDTEMASKG